MSQAIERIESHGEYIAVDVRTLESQEEALTEIANMIAEKSAAAEASHETNQREIDLLRARWWVVKRNVVELRRRFPRINCVLSDGSIIYDMEAADS